MPLEEMLLLAQGLLDSRKDRLGVPRSTDFSLRLDHKGKILALNLFEVVQYLSLCFLAFSFT